MAKDFTEEECSKENNRIMKTMLMDIFVHVYQSTLPEIGQCY